MDLSLTIGVNDLTTTIAFYRQIPGLDPHWVRSPGGTNTAISLATSGLTVIFMSLSAMEQQHPALLQHLFRERLGAGIQLEFTCPDLDSLHRIARQQQWSIPYQLEDQEHLRRELWLQDPDGYLLVFNEETAT